MNRLVPLQFRIVGDIDGEGLCGHIPVRPCERAAGTGEIGCVGRAGHDGVVDGDIPHAAAGTVDPHDHLRLGLVNRVGAGGKVGDTAAFRDRRRGERQSTQQQEKAAPPTATPVSHCRFSFICPAI